MKYCGVGNLISLMDTTKTRIVNHIVFARSEVFTNLVPRNSDGWSFTLLKKLNSSHKATLTIVKRNKRMCVKLNFSSRFAGLLRSPSRVFSAPLAKNKRITQKRSSHRGTSSTTSRQSMTIPEINSNLSNSLFRIIIVSLMEIRWKSSLNSMPINDSFAHRTLNMEGKRY